MKFFRSLISSQGNEIVEFMLMSVIIGGETSTGVIIGRTEPQWWQRLGVIVKKILSSGVCVFIFKVRSIMHF